MAKFKHDFWIMWRPACIDVDNLIEELSENEYQTTEQPKEMMLLRQKKDQKYTLLVKKKNPSNIVKFIRRL